MNTRVIAAFFLVVIGIIFQLLAGDARGVWFNFALAALISLSFFVNFFEILFLTLFTLLALNWQPGISFELIIFGVLPIGSFLLRKSLPFEPWAGSILLSCVGIVFFYALFGIHIIIRNPALFLGDILLSLIYSAIVFKAMTLSFRAAD